MSRRTFNRYSVAAMACLAIAGMAGCGTTQTISAAPPPIIKSAAVVDDFKATAANLNAAVTAGVLPANDPAAACVNDALVKTGITPPAGAATPSSFTVTNAGLVSAGSIAYIKVRMAQAAQPVTIATSCKELLGQLQIDGLAAAASPVGTLETLLGLPKFK